MMKSNESTKVSVQWKTKYKVYLIIANIIITLAFLIPYLFYWLEHPPTNFLLESILFLSCFAAVLVAMKYIAKFAGKDLPDKATK